MTSPRDLLKVEHSNTLANVTATGMEILHRKGGMNILENGLRTAIWDYTPIKDCLENIDARKTITDYCGYPLNCSDGPFSPWQKRTCLASTVSGLEAAARHCTGSRICSFSGKPHVSLVGRAPDGGFVARKAQAYPVGLCAAIMDVLDPLLPLAGGGAEV